jgi:hypothetical protein
MHDLKENAEDKTEWGKLVDGSNHGDAILDATGRHCGKRMAQAEVNLAWSSAQSGKGWKEV